MTQEGAQKRRPQIKMRRLPTQALVAMQPNRKIIVNFGDFGFKVRTKVQCKYFLFILAIPRTRRLIYEEHSPSFVPIIYKITQKVLFFV